MEVLEYIPTVRDYNDTGKTEIMFQLTNSSGRGFPKFPPNELIPYKCEILYHPTMKEKSDGMEIHNRLIAFVPGMPSIFVDEWSDREKKRLEKGTGLTSINFKLGFKVVSIKEKTLLMYLRISGLNKASDQERIDGSVLYFEVNYEELSKKIVEKDRKIVYAKYFVNEFPIEEVRAYALALAETKGEVDKIHGMDEYSLRYKMMDKAVKTPELFSDGISEPKLKNKAAIYRSLQEGIINIDNKNTEISWTSSNEVFVESPSGMDVVTYFSDLATKNEDYNKFMEAIRDLLNEKKEIKKLPDDWITVFINQSIKDGGLINSANWYMVPGVEEDSDPVIKLNGMKNLRGAIQSNKDNIMGLINMKSNPLEE